jgi:hypothetical protein
MSNWDVQPRIAQVRQAVNAPPTDPQEWASYPTIERATGNLTPWRFPISPTTSG